MTANQLVGFNFAWFRRAAGRLQEDVGKSLGWTNTVVSMAERSWDGKRVRHFDADEILAISDALGIPVLALFLPPPDADTQTRYLIQTSRGRQNLTELLPKLVSVLGAFSHRDTSPISEALRQRLLALGTSSYVEDPVIVAVLDRAYEEGQALLTSSRRQAEQITSDSRARAESLERDAQERHRQALGSLIQTRVELERRVDDLRAFEREYRARLLAYLKGQVRDLEAGAKDSGVFPAIAVTEPPPAAGPEGRYPSYPQEPEET